MLHQFILSFSYLFPVIMIFTTRFQLSNLFDLKKTHKAEQKSPLKINHVKGLGCFRIQNAVIVLGLWHLVCIFSQNLAFSILLQIKSTLNSNVLLMIVSIVAHSSIRVHFVGQCPFFNARLLFSFILWCWEAVEHNSKRFVPL